MTLLLALMLAGQPPAPPKPPASPDEEKGRELFRAGKFDEAAEAFRKAAKANPSLPPANVALAELFFQAQQRQAAQQALERAATEDPEHPAVLLLNASFALNEGRVTDTILSCTAALRAAESPRWDAAQRTRYQREARLGLTAGLEARRDYNAAREQLVALSTADPKSGVLRARLAATLFLTGKPDDALAEFTAAFRDDATLDPPELQMAKLWAARPDPAKAEEWFAKATAAHPKNARAAREFAGWLLTQGKADGAKPLIDAAAALDPGGRDTAAVRGLHARYTRDFAAAERVFDDMYRNSPRDRFAGLNLALVLAEAGDDGKKKRAVELAESLVQQNQKAADGYAVLGWCYFQVGRTDDALKALQTAASGGQIELDTGYYLAKVLVAKDKPDEAREVLKKTTAATAPFVNRAAAVALLAEVDAKFPPKK